MVEAIEIDPSAAREATVGDAMIGRCGAMQVVYKAIGRVAAQNVTVLIRGESGTGKELVARALYQHSKRSKGPFLAVNCAAIPETLLESELFGHEKGAFTGADRKRIGKFEQCNGGTLFLDEIGDMSPPLQSKLLRILQEQRFERIGGNETIETDVRVIAATNRNMERMVQESQFRGDLYYRLNGYTISLPPLRDRGDDLLLLIDHFLAAASRDLDREVRGVAPEAMAVLRRYSWPGNVRELQSVIRQAVLDTTGPVLFPDALPQVVLGTEAGADFGRSPSVVPRRCLGVVHCRTHPGRCREPCTTRRWKPSSARSSRWSSSRPTETKARPASYWASRARRCEQRSRSLASRSNAWFTRKKKTTTDPSWSRLSVLIIETECQVF